MTPIIIADGLALMYLDFDGATVTITCPACRETARNLLVAGTQVEMSIKHDDACMVLSLVRDAQAVRDSGRPPTRSLQKRWAKAMKVRERYIASRREAQ